MIAGLVGRKTLPSASTLRNLFVCLITVDSLLLSLVKLSPVVFVVVVVVIVVLLMVYVETISTPVAAISTGDASVK